jgi:V/A-type H+-transporting ATPase subunit E
MLIPEASAARIETLLQAKASDVLASGLKIKPVAGLKEGFSIVNAGDGFKVSFTDEDFQAFFTALMKPKIREFLFSQETA